MHDLVGQVNDALNLLGSTAAEIADALCNKGIRGVCGDEKRCAVAEYLAEQFPELEWSIGAAIWGTVPAGQCASTIKVSVPIAGALAEFIVGFDENVYPELVLS